MLARFIRKQDSQKVVVLQNDKSIFVGLLEKLQMVCGTPDMFLRHSSVSLQTDCVALTYSIDLICSAFVVNKRGLNVIG